jgi:hypothetical protein
MNIPMGYMICILAVLHESPSFTSNMFIGCSFDAMVYPESYLLFWRNGERRKNDACAVGFSRRVVSTWKIVIGTRPMVARKNSTYKSWFVNNFSDELCR